MARLEDQTGPIWRNGAFHPDEWLRYPEDTAEALPAGRSVLVPLPVFLEEPERFLCHDGPLGVELPSGGDAHELEPYLWRLALIALVFPKFSDGRSYSAARLLRERYGFRGELRAVGDVLIDQVTQMRRCGIDAFRVTHEPTRRRLIQGKIPAVRLYYQPTADVGEAPVGTRPWARRPAA